MWNGEGTAGSGYRLAAELMRAQDPPTAIFCGNSPTAMGAYEALKERGLRIPEDVAVVGFDNQELPWSKTGANAPTPTAADRTTTPARPLIFAPPSGRAIL